MMTKNKLCTVNTIMYYFVHFVCSSTTPQQWEQFSRYNVTRAKEEMQASVQIRENNSITRAQVQHLDYRFNHLVYLKARFNIQGTYWLVVEQQYLVWSPFTTYTCLFSLRCRMSWKPNEWPWSLLSVSELTTRNKPIMKCNGSWKLWGFILILPPVFYIFLVV